MSYLCSANVAYMLFVNNKQNILILCDKKTPVKKFFLISFFCIFNRFFLVLKLLYERNCSTKGTAQLLKLLICTETALFFVTVNKLKENIHNNKASIFWQVRKIGFE